LIQTATIYRITKQTGFYEEICNLLIALQGIAVSTEYILGGKANYSPGDYLTVEAKHLNSEVRLPVFGPIQAAIQGLEPDQIEISILRKKDIGGFYPHEISGLQRFIDSIFKPFIVSYFEAYKSEIEIKFPAGRDKWPDVWQMSWAVRNAISHNGTVYSRNPNGKPVSWKGLHHSPSIEQNSPILQKLNGGDMLVLLIEMEEIRTGIPLHV
jgi:hypothetical protein